MNKGECRQILQARRQAIDSSRREKASRDAYVHFSQLTEGCSLVLSYASTGTELDLQPLNASLAKKGVLVLPRIEGAFLRLFVVDDLSLLKSNQWNILEPDPHLCDEVDPSNISLTLVPGLGYDPLNNHRIGYGKGFYDRLLSLMKSDSQKYGVGFKEQSFENIPIDKNDIPLSKVFFF